MKLFCGPPGSGKTTRALALAGAALAAGKRVWWVGLPNQRGYIYRRATEAGALLGLEFLSSQQVYYRLLAHALKLKPLVVGTGRTVLVGEALKRHHDALPSPGEARLFTRAISEAKRFGLRPEDIAGHDPESERLRAVFAHYRDLKGEAWDYDDFRAQALELARSGAARPEAELVIVDGFRELGPLDLRFYKALGAHCELYLSSATCPPGETVHEQLKVEKPPTINRYRAANPVSEARWVLRAVKRDLALGADPLDLAVIAPKHQATAFAALADEYGVPLMEEAPLALVDTPAGRSLLDRLELPDYPTPSKVLAIPELVPLANAALKRQVTGREAFTALATELEMAELWQSWLRRLAVPERELEWARSLVENLNPTGATDDFQPPEVLRDHMMERAKEAASVAKGEAFRVWWVALLQETSLPRRPKGGVALLDDKLVSGRRFKRVYLMHATEGAYSVGEREDYFLPEERRASLAEVFASEGMPKRFLGRDSLLFDELLSRGDEVVVTYPEADQGGPLVPETKLVGEGPVPELPPLPAGSRLELSGGRYRADSSSFAMGSVTVQGLFRYDRCAFRYWGERRVPRETAEPWWLRLLTDLREGGHLTKTKRHALCEAYPEAASWLHAEYERLAPLSFGISLPERSEGPRAYLDAAHRSGSAARLYRFVAPGRLGGQAEAKRYLDGRWNELWAAGQLLDGYGGRIQEVHFYVWPLLGQAVEIEYESSEALRRKIAERQRRVQKTYRRYSQGDLSPEPGFICRDCSVFDLCREGRR